MPNGWDDWDLGNETEQPQQPEEENPPIETEPLTDDEPLIIGEWNLTEAREYVTYNAIDNEDFLANDQTNQVRFLNVAKRTLSRKYNGYTIPAEATYLFACVLNANYNDTLVMDKRGIASFSIDGMSFTFKDWAQRELSELVSEEIADIVAEANPELSIGNGRVKWVTL